MNLREWSESEVEYGRKVVNSGLAGARSGREAFLDGRPLTPILGKTVRNASTPAAVGAILGLLGSFAGNHPKSAKRALVFGFLGGRRIIKKKIAWKNRELTACEA